MTAHFKLPYLGTILLLFAAVLGCSENTKRTTFAKVAVDTLSRYNWEQDIEFYGIPPLDSVPALMPVFDSIDDAKRFMLRLERLQFEPQEVVLEKEVHLADSLSRNATGIRHQTFTFASGEIQYHVTMAYEYCLADGRFLNVYGMTGEASGLARGAAELVIPPSANIYPDQIIWHAQVRFVIAFRYKEKVYSYLSDVEEVKGVLRQPEAVDTSAYECSQRAKDYYYPKARMTTLF